MHGIAHRRWTRAAALALVLAVGAPSATAIADELRGPSMEGSVWNVLMRDLDGDLYLTSFSFSGGLMVWEEQTTPYTENTDPALRTTWSTDVCEGGPEFQFLGSRTGNTMIGLRFYYFGPPCAVIPGGLFFATRAP